MADLNWLRIKHPRGPREAFEDMCTLVFCTRLGLAHGVNRRINQKGIESDPVAIGGRVYAYQAKFYDAATQLSGKKDDLIGAVRAARQEGVTDLMLFVDKNLPDKVLNGDGTARVEPSWLAEINEAADGEGDEPKVTLDWWTLSRIESTLDMDAYRYIRDIYLGGDGGQAGYTDFYEWVCDRYYGDIGSDLYGNVPLSECYIEPTIRLGNGEPQSAREFIESWVENGTIAVICGEPGHGKTSLCRKAVCDFYKTGWLAGQVSNVFHFSLSPTGTGALDHDSFRFNSLLSWGAEDDRMEPEQRIKAKDCRDALVFLDGFDELLESHPVGMEDFIKERIVKFQRKTCSHVIITTRSTVVESGKDRYDLGSMYVPIARLQPITKEEQLGWIEKYSDYLHRSIASNSEPSSQEDAGETEKELVELREYYRDYERVDDDVELQGILGIPIIFRMVVAARYLPEGEASLSRIYDGLFEAIWKRYDLLTVSTTNAEKEAMDAAKRELSRHALRVFANDTDTALVDGVLESPWVFSYYMTRKSDELDESKSRVGFLHRSIYQHFLAREILSWFVSYADGCDSKYDESAFGSDLSNLARRRLGKTTLAFIQDMYDEIHDERDLGSAFVKAYEILKKTDGFLPLPGDDYNAAHIDTVTPLNRANNVFWNIVSVCSICGYALTTGNVNSGALRLYDLKECCLVDAQMEKAFVERADLRGATLRRAILQRANLRGADLWGTDLQGANLRGASLRGANLLGAILRRADLQGADLREADLRGADLRRANLQWAILRRADLQGENLRGLNLKGTDLREADLRGADLQRIDLCGSDLRGANLLGSDLRGAQLFESDFRGTNLRGADLRGADIRRVDLELADLRGARFTRREDLIEAILDGTNLDGAVFDEDSQELQV